MKEKMRMYNYFQVRWLNGYNYVSDAPNNINLFIESLLDKLRPESESVNIGYHYDEKTSISFGILVFQVLLKSIERNCNYYHIVAYASPNSRYLNKGAFEKLFKQIYGDNIKNEITDIYNKISKLEKSKGRSLLDKYRANTDIVNMVETKNKQEIQEDQNKKLEKLIRPSQKHFPEIENKPESSKKVKPIAEKSKSHSYPSISLISLFLSVIALSISIYYGIKPKIIDTTGNDIHRIIRNELNQQISEFDIQELVKQEVDKGISDYNIPSLVKSELSNMQSLTEPNMSSANTSDELIQDILKAIGGTGYRLTKNELKRVAQNNILILFSRDDQDKISKLQLSFDDYDTDKDGRLSSQEVKVAVYH